LSELLVHDGPTFKVKALNDEQQKVHFDEQLLLPTWPDDAHLGELIKLNPNVFRLLPHFDVQRELEQALNDELQARLALDGQHEVPIQLLSELI
jgi:hypothetical protein